MDKQNSRESETMMLMAVRVWLAELTELIDIHYINFVDNIFNILANSLPLHGNPFILDMPACS